MDNFNSERFQVRQLVMIKMINKLYIIQTAFCSLIVKKLSGLTDIVNRKYKGVMKNGRNSICGNLWNNLNSNQQRSKQIILELV